MHEIHVRIVSPEATENGVTEVWAAEELIGYTILDDSDLMLHIDFNTARWQCESCGANIRPV